MDALVIHTSHNFRPADTLPRLSQHVETFIRDVLGDEPANLLMKPTIAPPTARSDLSMVDYFVSSSHNTYLLSKQVLGRCSSDSYTHVLTHGARCVEIDVWPSKSGPIVTHGYTLSQSIPFSDVCIAIGASVQPDTWPVLVSLECHVYGEREQAELVRIMREAWGSKFVDHALDGIPKRLPPDAVMGKILVMVEHYLPPVSDIDEVVSSSSSSSDSEPDLGKDTRNPDEQLTQRPQNRISLTLAEVGYYFRSVKPPKNWFSRLFPDPPNILLNVSESSLFSLLTSSTMILDALITHAQAHMRRVYPKGLRITSSNLRPHIFWGAGSHVVALNWQTYDLGMQINEAMFVGTPGWVMKPDWMRTPGSGDHAASERRMKVQGKIVGICNCPPPSDRKRTADSKPYNAYLKAQLLLPASSSLFHSSSILRAVQTSTEVEYTSEAQRVQPITGDLNFAYPTNTDSTGGLWTWPWKGKEHEKDSINAEFEWEIWQKWEELTFLRMTICEKEFGKDDTLAIFCARVADIRRAVQEADSPRRGWRAVRLLDTMGKDCGSVALVHFSFTEI